MLFERTVIEKLISDGEGQHLELKDRIPDPDTVATNLAALANTDGGMLILGARDSNRILGVDANRASSVLNTALKRLSPQPSVKAGSVSIGSKTVYCMQVEKSKDLVASSGGYFKREGERNKPLTLEQLKEQHFSQEQLQSSLSQLSQALERQSKTIESMDEALKKANSIPRKVGLAAIGAILGALAKHLLDLLT